MLRSKNQFFPTLVSVVLPAYDELENLKILIPKIAENLEGYSFEILLVDDNSPDGTRGYFQNLSLPFLKLVSRTGPQGFALSIRDGIEAATGNIVVIMDSDGNHQPEYLPILVENIRYFECVLGSRFQYGGGMPGWFRHKCSWVFNIATRILTGGMITDHLYGFIAIRRKTLDAVEFDKVFWGYGDYCIRLLYFLQKQNVSILQIPSQNGTRLHGAANSRMVRVLLKYSYAVGVLVLQERLGWNVRKNPFVSGVRQRET